MSAKAVRVRTATGWQDVALRGPPGLSGATEVYEQADEPAAAGLGAIWLDTDENAVQIPTATMQLLAAATVLGTYNGYSAQFGIPASPPLQIWRDLAGTSPLRLTYTPPVNAWWDTYCHVGLMSKVDAAYNYSILALRLTPADADGVSLANAYLTQHNSVQQYEPKMVQRMWKLTAGVPYTLDGVFHGGGGTWSYHQWQDNLWLQGQVWARI